MVAEETATRIYTVDEYLELELTSENSSGIDHDQKFHEYIGMGCHRWTVT